MLSLSRLFDMFSGGNREQEKHSHEMNEEMLAILFERQRLANMLLLVAEANGLDHIVTARYRQTFEPLDGVVLDMAGWDAPPPKSPQLPPMEPMQFRRINDPWPETP